MEIIFCRPHKKLVQHEREGVSPSKEAKVFCFLDLSIKGCIYSAYDPRIGHIILSMDAIRR
ncbi:MAG: hypothetical protein ACI86M_001658 [Saprospiraceae bacterium]|jgi:hypothetical protein